MLLNSCALLSVAQARNLLFGPSEELSNSALVSVPLSALFQILSSIRCCDFVDSDFWSTRLIYYFRPFFPYICPKVLYFFVSWCVFRINVFVPQKTVQILSVRYKYFILMVFVLCFSVPKWCYCIFADAFYLNSSVISSKFLSLYLLYFLTILFLFIFCGFNSSLFYLCPSW